MATPWTDHLADLGQHIGTVIPGAGRCTGIENNEIIFGYRGKQRLFQQLGVVDNRQAATGIGPPFVEISGQDAGIEFDDLSGLRLLAGLDQLAAGGNDMGSRRALDLNLSDAGCQHGTLVDGSYCVAFREDELGCDNVFADGSHMLPGSGGHMQLDFGFA